MDYLKIGNYIQNQRKNKNLTQKELGEKLGVSFQAVSKWELGETLPDTALLLDLAEVLDTTVDKILNGGSLIIKDRKYINIQDVVDGFKAIEQIKKCFGEKSDFYIGTIDGINKRMNIDLETYLKDEKTREIMYVEVVLQYISNGGYVDMDDVRSYFKNQKMIKYIEDYQSKTK